MYPPCYTLANFSSCLQAGYTVGLFSAVYPPCKIHRVTERGRYCDRLTSYQNSNLIHSVYQVATQWSDASRKRGVLWYVAVVTVIIIVYVVFFVAFFFSLIKNLDPQRCMVHQWRNMTIRTMTKPTITQTIP